MNIKILVASESPATHGIIGGKIAAQYRVFHASSMAESFRQFRRVRPDVVLMDVELPGREPNRSAEEELSLFFREDPGARIIILTRKENEKSAVKAVEAGAASCLSLAADASAIISSVERVLEKTGGLVTTSAPEINRLEMLRTRSKVMGRVFEKIRRVAPTESTVLLTGETGTGKGVLARLLHTASRRAREPMVSVHCGAIPESLIESELFGHEKGAFTGAIRRKKGKFEAANRGTIFLDEIGTITATAQIKLLQVLQDRTYQPVGSENTLATDVRVVAATNMDLGGMSLQNEFRTDLYYRLNVFPVRVPPLRERAEDIPLLVEFFLAQLNRQNVRRIEGVSSEVMQALMSYSWPGNIRELENLVQRAHILENSTELTRNAFPGELFRGAAGTAVPDRMEWPTIAQVRTRAVEKAEEQYLRSVLEANRGRINPTAEIAGVGRRQIHKLLMKYNIKKELYK